MFNSELRSVAVFGTTLLYNSLIKQEKKLRLRENEYLVSWPDTHALCPADFGFLMQKKTQRIRLCFKNRIPSTFLVMVGVKI